MKLKIRYIIFFLLLFFFAHTANAQIADMLTEKARQGKSLSQIQTEMDEYFYSRDKGKGSGWKQYLRWLRSMAGAVNEAGEVVNPSARQWQSAYEFKEEMSHARVQSLGGAWFNLNADTIYQAFTNPLDVRRSGRVNCFAFHPNNPAIIYAGSNGGGLFRSTDNGLNWSNLTNGIPSLGISAVQVDPVNPDIIYILNGDGDSQLNYSTGVLKSFDGGENWFTTGLTFSYSDLCVGNALTLCNDNPLLLVVATTRGTYRSLNGGVTWSRGLTNRVFDVEFKPGSQNVVYATDNVNFYISNDTGRTWSAAPAGAFTPAKPANTNRIQIGVSPAAPNEVYLLMGPGNGRLGTAGFAGLYKSLNGGVSFTLQKNTPNVLGYFSNGAASVDQSGYDLAIAVSPTNSASVFVGGIQLWSSANSGVNWLNANTATACSGCPATRYIHADVHAIAFNGSTIYVGSDGGVYRSTNNGSSWSFVSARMNAMEFYHIADYDESRFLLVGGTQDNGAFRYRTDYFDFMACCDAGAAMINRSDSSQFIVNGSSNFLYRTTNSGATTTDVTPWTGCNCLDETAGVLIVDIVEQDPVYDSVIYAMQRDFYKSTDGGATWTRNITDSNSVLDYHIALAVSPVNNSIMYATGNLNFRMSSDGGVTWRIKNNIPTIGRVSGVAVSSTDARKLWVCVSNFADGQKVYESLDSGSTWVNISAGLPNIRMQTIEHVNGSQDGLYVGTDLGVFYRDDNTGFWFLFSNGLPNVMVRDLEINYLEGIISAATFGRGLWQSSLYSGCPVNLSHTSGFFQPPVYGSEYFAASNTITSNRTISGGIGTSVVYSAGDVVQLTPGFHCVAGSRVAAVIGGCSPAPLRPLSGNLAGSLKDYLNNVEMTGSLVPGTASVLVSLFPNPATGNVAIEVLSEIDQLGVIRIFDGLGRVVSTELSSIQLSAGANSFQLDLSRMVKGVYQVSLKTSEKEVSRKLVVL